MRCDEVIGQDRLHIACVEGSVRDPVLISIDKSILDSLWHILDPDDRATALCQVVGNRPSTCIEVVDHLIARELSVFTHLLIEPLRLPTIRLVEGLRSDTVTQAVHILLDVWRAAVELRWEVG